MASSDPVARPRSHRQADKKTSEKQTAIVLNLHCKLPAFSSKHQRYLWHQSVSGQHGLCCVFYRSEDQSSISWTFLVIVCVELQRKHQGKDYNLYYLIWAYQNIFLKLFYDIREIGQINLIIWLWHINSNFIFFYLSIDIFFAVSLTEVPWCAHAKVMDIVSLFWQHVLLISCIFRLVTEECFTSLVHVPPVHVCSVSI